MTPLFPPAFGAAVDNAVGAARHTAGEFVRWSVEAVLPDGGQRTARQNAWIAMGEEARHARDRREAEAALSWAVMRSTALAAHPAQGGSTLPGAAGVLPTV
jgi:hypothetical protein